MAEQSFLDGPRMTTHPALYACFNALEFPLQALLRLRPELRSGMRQKPVAVLEGRPPLERVCSINPRAENLGIVRGMTRVEAETFPSAIVLLRSYAEEAEARTALLECASRFSPRIEDRSRDGCFTAVLDITGTTKLFGEPQKLGERLLELATSFGIRASVVIAGNLPAALCLATGMGMSSGVLVVPAGEEMSALKPMPLSVLDLSPDHIELFSSWGIDTLGELGNLPEEDLIARLGQEGKRLRQLARGEAQHLFTPVEPAFTLEERAELDFPVEVFASLLFLLAGMLDRLIARARSNLLALASITLHSTLEGGGLHMRTIRSALPSNDRQLWLKLLDLDLQAHPPPAAVVSLGLSAQTGGASKVQLGLFCPQVPEPMRLDVTLARIRAIVGEDCVGRAVLKDKHHPDAFCMEPFVVPAASTGETRPGGPCAALRQIRPPEVVAVGLHNHSPSTFVFRKKRYIVERAYGPWFAAGDWWNAELWSLEQWDLVARELQEPDRPTGPARFDGGKGYNGGNGLLLCCCLTRDLVHDRWQMEALYD
jgi:protein ImuB